MSVFKKIIIVIGIGISVYFVGIIFYVFTPALTDLTNRTDFDSQVWIGWQEAESTLQVRWNMVNDLTKNYELKKKSTSEIKNLLGKPSKESNGKMYYALGVTGRGINTGTLILKIEDGIVIDFDVVQG